MPTVLDSRKTKKVQLRVVNSSEIISQFFFTRFIITFKVDRQQLYYTFRPLHQLIDIVNRLRYKKSLMYNNHLRHMHVL